MNEYYNIIAQIEENRKIAMEKANHTALVKLAKQANPDDRWSKLLVKLAGILINAGNQLKKHAEKDLQRQFPVVLQDL